MALANNKDIDGSRIDREKAVNSVSGAKGSFDPRVGGTRVVPEERDAGRSSLGGSTTGSVINRNGLADPQLLRKPAVARQQLSAGFLFVADHHQQQLRAAQPAISDIAEFLVHAAAVAQPALRRQSPSPGSRQEERVAHRRTVSPAGDADRDADRAGLLGPGVRVRESGSATGGGETGPRPGRKQSPAAGTGIARAHRRGGGAAAACDLRSQRL